jgi:hypothetical protein
LPEGVEGDITKWVTVEVTKFLRHEQSYALEMRNLIQQVPSFARLVDEPGLFERVTTMQPESIFPQFVSDENHRPCLTKTFQRTFCPPVGIEDKRGHTIASIAIAMRNY